jgi:hypothetical protein
MRSGGRAHAAKQQPNGLGKIGYGKFKWLSRHGNSKNTGKQSNLQGKLARLTV